MPPRVAYTREQVLDAAFAVLTEEGWPAVTTRAIAARLGASTQPIYSHVRSMEELGAVLRERAVLALAAYQARSRTGDVLLDMAVGYVRFAQELPNLFSFLYLERAAPPAPGEQERLYGEVARLSGRELPVDISLGALGEGGRHDLTRKAWLFTHGLAVALSRGALAPMTEAETARLLAEGGEALYRWELAQQA